MFVPGSYKVSGVEEGVKIYPYSQICMGVKIGEGTTIGHNVFIGEKVSIGKGCRIHSNGNSV